MISETLARECQTYCRYLVRRPPSEYISSKYAEYHHLHPDNDSERNLLDQVLLSVSRLHPFLTGVADSYAVWFRRSGVLRRKLVLMLALTEATPPYFRYLDAPDRGPRIFFLGRFFGLSLFHLIQLAIGIPILVPVHVWSVLRQPGGEGKTRAIVQGEP